MRMVKVLKIPTAHLCGTGVAFVPQLRTPDVAVQELRNHTRMGTIEAKLYLEDAGWDVAKALAAWRDDNEWEAGAAADAKGTVPQDRRVKAAVAKVEEPPQPPKIQVTGVQVAVELTPVPRALPTALAQPVVTKGLETAVL